MRTAERLSKVIPHKQKGNTNMSINLKNKQEIVKDFGKTKKTQVQQQFKSL